MKGLAADRTAVGSLLDASVIIPVLNEGPRVRRCLDAVRAQEHGSFEVIVVDGGSTDAGLEHVQKVPVRLLAAPGTTAGAARNVGAAHAQGRFLVFTDADCVPQRGWLRALTRHLDQHPGLVGAGGALRNAVHGRPGRYEDWDTQACYRGVITSNVAYRAEAFRSVGGFDPSLRCAEDWDLAWRLAATGARLGFCDEAVVVHEPVENRHYRAFARKQVWYARSDLPAFAKCWRGPAAGRPEVRPFVRTAAAHAAGAALVASVVLAPLGAALLGGWALQKTLRTAARVPEARRAFLGLWAHNTFKAMARGAGTWRGLADLLRSSGQAGGHVAPAMHPATELTTALALRPEVVPPKAEMEAPPPRAS